MENSSDDVGNLTSLVDRIQYRLSQDDNAFWATACLCFLCLLIFIGFMKSRLWEKYNAPELLGLHDDIEDMTYQSAADVDRSKKRWNFRFRRKQQGRSPLRALTKPPVHQTSPKHQENEPLITWDSDY